jgi:hypothetical protein
MSRFRTERLTPSARFIVTGTLRSEVLTISTSAAQKLLTAFHIDLYRLCLLSFVPSPFCYEPFTTNTAQWTMASMPYLT